MRRQDQWIVVPAKPFTLQAYRDEGYIGVAYSDTYYNEQQMIVGLRSQELVDSLLGHLPEEAKVVVKTEIASIATDLAVNLLNKN